MDTLDLQKVLEEKISKVLEKRPENVKEYANYLKQEGVDLKPEDTKLLVLTSVADRISAVGLKTGIRTPQGVIPENVPILNIPGTKDLQTIFQVNKKNKQKKELQKEIRKVLWVANHYMDESGECCGSIQSFVEVMEDKGISVAIKKRETGGATDLVFSKEGVNYTARKDLGLNEEFDNFKDDMKNPKLTKHLVDIRYYLGQEKEAIDRQRKKEILDAEGCDFSGEREASQEELDRRIIIKSVEEILDHFKCVKRLGLIEKTSIEDLENQLWGEEGITFDIRENEYGKKQMFFRKENRKKEFLYLFHKRE